MASGKSATPTTIPINENQLGTCNETIIRVSFRTLQSMPTAETDAEKVDISFGPG